MRGHYDDSAIKRTILLVNIGYDVEEYTYSVVTSDSARSRLLLESMTASLNDIGINPAILGDAKAKQRIAAVLSDPFDVAGFRLGGHIGRVNFLAAVVLDGKSIALRDLSEERLRVELDVLRGRVNELGLMADWGLTAGDFEALRLRPETTLAEYSRQLEVFKEHLQAALYHRMSVPT